MHAAPSRERVPQVPRIRPADDVLDAVHQQRARRLEEHLIIVGIEPAHCETAAACQPAERIREPAAQAGEAIEYEQIAVVGGSTRSSRGSARTGAALGSIKALSIFDRTITKVSSIIMCIRRCHAPFKVLELNHLNGTANN